MDEIRANLQSKSNHGLLKNCFSLWFLPEFESRVFLADVIKILHKDIDIDKLFDFFKDLNSDSEGNVYEGQQDMDEGTLEQINSHINLPITKDGIFKCVRKCNSSRFFVIF
jgi:hypothetical protein